MATLVSITKQFWHQVRFEAGGAHGVVVQNNVVQNNTRRAI